MTIKEFERQRFITAFNPSTNIKIDLFIDHFGFENSFSVNETVKGSDAATYRLHLVIKGSSYLSDGKRTYRVTKNRCFLLDPTSPYFIQRFEKNNEAHYWVAFSGKEAKNYLALMGFSQNTPIVDIPPDITKKLRYAFFRSFAPDHVGVEYTELIFFENFYRICDLLVQAKNRKLASSSKATELGTSLYIVQALEYVKNHYTESDVTLYTVANTLGLHKNYFSPLFKKHVGVPFNAYLNQMRIHRAVALIKEGETSVSKIAELVGIPDPSYFVKVFKKYNSITPAQEIAKRKKLR